MNFAIPDADSVGGLIVLEPAHAKAAAAFLRDHLPRVDDAEQAGVLASVRALEHAATPEVHFDVALYTPAWYVPGWEPMP